MIRVANTRTVLRQEGEHLIYIGRGRLPDGMEHAHLGNPFKVGTEFQQGEAALAYRAFLRERCRERGAVYRTIIALARRLAEGERLVLCCWCSPKPCHGEHVMAAVLGYARRDFGYQG